MKNYYPQIFTYLIMVNNNISGSLMSSSGNHIAMNGNVGDPEYWYYWLTFDHYGQIQLYLFMMLIYMIFPLNGVFHHFAIYSIALYSLLTLVEAFLYQWTGSGFIAESLYFYLIGIYTAGLLIIFVKLKAWTQ
jgi:hypothetical protein